MICARLGECRSYIFFATYDMIILDSDDKLPWRQKDSQGKLVLVGRCIDNAVTECCIEHTVNPRISPPP